MVFCAYCGKSFTRKEHLERHLPSHTNVKPHRCGSCQLSFARRDLLNRHHATYHEAREPGEPIAGAPPTIAGRTPIACLNCAQAKTGCDKRVPCARCTDKHLNCQARFARRSSKAAMRAAQINNPAGLHRAPLPQSSHLPLPNPSHGLPAATINPTMMDIDHSVVKQEDSINALIAHSSPDNTTIDPQIQHNGNPINNSPVTPHTSPTNNNFEAANNTTVEKMEDFFDLPTSALSGSQYMPELAFAGSDYQDPNSFMWGEYPIGIEAYGGNMQHHDQGLPSFPEHSDISSNSEHLSSSTRGSVHTRSTSIMSTGDFDPNMKPAEPNSQSIETATQIAEQQQQQIILHTSMDKTVSEPGAAIAQEASWHSQTGQCAPSDMTGVCGKTAVVHLECLEKYRAGEPLDHRSHEGSSSNPQQQPCQCWCLLCC